MSQPRPQSLAQKRILKAKALIREKRYEEARELLKNLEHNDTAKQWLKKIDSILLEEDDPFGDSPSRVQNHSKLPDYNVKSFVVFLMYLMGIFIPLAIVLNFYWYSEGSKLEKQHGRSIKGVGTLRTMRYIILALLVFFVIVAIIGFAAEFAKM